MNGALGTADGRSDLVCLALRLIVEEAPKARFPTRLAASATSVAKATRLATAIVRRAAVGRIRKDFCNRDLAERGVLYLFVDGIAEHLRPGRKVVLLGLMADSKGGMSRRCGPTLV